MTEKFDLSYSWFSSLRDQICQSFEKLEKENIFSHDKFSHTEAGFFQRENWNRPGGGGGEISLMRGRVFEKIGANISKVYGSFSENFAKEIPGTENDLSFKATGISVVAHMYSPYIPAIHMNTRFIETEKHWFGGVIDLNPAIIIEEDAEDFHHLLKNICDKYNVEYYPRFKKECDKYFHISHRKKDRGVGGIFVDYLNTGNWEEDFSFIKDIGTALLDFFPSIVKKYLEKDWTEVEKERQFTHRAHYAEFNLLYDRGTRFGLMTEGNVEAILMSMPPLAKW